MTKALTLDDARPRVVTLCGSSRFPEAFHLVNAHLSMQGVVVISLGCFGHADEPRGARFLTSDGNEQTTEKQALDQLHFRKIDISDGVFVVNVGGYVGSSTRREIDYARSQGKTVEWLFPPEAAILARQEIAALSDGDRTRADDAQVGGDEELPPPRIRVERDPDGFWSCAFAVSGSPEYIRVDLYDEALRSRDATIADHVRRIADLEQTLRTAPRPGIHPEMLIDPVVYMDWYFKTRGRALSQDKEASS